VNLLELHPPPVIQRLANHSSNHEASHWFATPTYFFTYAPVQLSRKGLPVLLLVVLLLFRQYRNPLCMRASKYATVFNEIDRDTYQWCSLSSTLSCTAHALACGHDIQGSPVSCLGASKYVPEREGDLYGSAGVYRTQCYKLSTSLCQGCIQRAHHASFY
jgi:hypothetical protein